MWLLLIFLKLLHSGVKIENHCQVCACDNLWFQAVCKDEIFPYIRVFATGYGKSDEPRRAYALTFFIAVACVCIGTRIDILCNKIWQKL